MLCVSAFEPFTCEEIQSSILECEEYYAPCVLKKNFEAFLADKFKKVKKGPAQPAREAIQRQRAKEEYHQLFTTAVDQQKTSLYNLYYNAFRGGELGLLVLGNRETLTADIKHNFEILNDVHEGSVSIIDRWNILKNDLMLLGAIHGCRSCMLHEVEKGVFWNERESRPRVIAREVIMLRAAGYELYRHPYVNTLGHVFLSPCSERRFTLKEATEALSDLDRKAQALARFFEIDDT